MMDESSRGLESDRFHGGDASVVRSPAASSRIAATAPNSPRCSCAGSRSSAPALVPARAAGGFSAFEPDLDPVQEPSRLQALRGLGLLDSAAEPPFDRLTRLASRILRAPVSLVSLVDRDRQFFKSSVGLPEPLAKLRETPLSHSFCQHVVRGSAPLVIRDARGHALVKDNGAVKEMGVVAYLGMPLVTRSGHVIGSLCVIDNRPREWGDDDLEILRDLAASVMTEIDLREDIADRLRVEGKLRASRSEVAEQLRIAVALNEALERQRGELSVVNERLAEIASRDGLTGLRNRRFFAEALEDLHQRAILRQQPISIILADIDDFKRYNDTHGHVAGDEVLRGMAEIFRAHTRDHDVAARYGGEEFIVVLPETNAAGASATAARLLAAVRGRIWPNRPITASFGVATLHPGMAPPWDVVERADAALYQSKREGRDRVTLDVRSDADASGQRSR